MSGTTAKATITGKGVYTGSVEKTFTISAASIAEAEVTVSGTYTYTGAAIQPTTGNISVTFNNEELRAGTDYEIQGYSNNTNAATANSENAPTVTIKGKGNYSGTVTQTFTIAAKDLASATVTVDPTQTYTYTGSAITPNVSSVSIKLTEGAEAATNLTAGTDYTVTGYANNTNAATATSENAPIVTITGQGNFTGTATGKFTIAQADLSDAEIADIDNQDYTGEAVTPEPQVSVVLIAGNDPTVLVKGQDFNYNYENNVAVSSETNTPKVIVTGTGNYTGSAQKTFNIVLFPAVYSLVLWYLKRKFKHCFGSIMIHLNGRVMIRDTIFNLKIIKSSDTTPSCILFNPLIKDVHHSFYIGI